MNISCSSFVNDTQSIFESTMDCPYTTSTPIRNSSSSRTDSCIKRRSTSLALNDSLTPCKRKNVTGRFTALSLQTEDPDLSLVPDDVDVHEHNETHTNPSSGFTHELKKVSKEEVTVERYVNICEQDVPYITYDGEMFIASDQVLRLAGINVKRGYGAVDAILQDKKLRKQPTFLIHGHKRSWIRKTALLAILRDRTLYKKAKKKVVEEAIISVEKRDRSTSCSSDITALSQPETVVATDSWIGAEQVADGHFIQVCGMEIPYYQCNDKIFVEFDRLSDYAGIKAHVMKNSWKYVDSCLSKQDIDITASFNTVKPRVRRTHISVVALQALLSKFKPGIMEKKKQLNHELSAAMVKMAASKSGPASNENPLQGLVSDQLSLQKQVLLDGLVDIISKPKPRFVDGEQFNGTLAKEDITYVMKSAYDKSSTPVQMKIKQSVHEMYKYIHPVAAEDLVYICDNYSGTKLMSEMRKKLPGVMPSVAQERIAKSNYKKAFHAVLLPRRTATGWCISPSRLLDMISFRYPFLEDNLKVRIWGDGREIGGRHSTFLAITIVNHDLHLRNISYQNPHETFPIAIFYESDSRDNLEMNLGFNNIVEMLQRQRPQHDYFLCGDEMFIIKVLDGSKELSPTSATGWMFYHKASKEQKKETASSGLRTDLTVKIDRQHPESLFPSIPLENIVFDVMHGLTRIVEKLLNLEIEKILSEGNKGQQSNNSTPSSRQLLDNLAANINRRGIRQGNFKIFFDRSGKPEPVSLNKDHAFGIISRPPVGKEAEFPHVLQNVIPKRSVQLPLSSEVQAYIRVHNGMTEYDLVIRIWDSLCAMFNIVKSEPSPILLPGRPVGSLHAADYEWGYSEATMQDYKVYAECFYQLMCWRYTWQNVTPYMIKFIDYARYFMNKEIPICRFQAEGGEHLNYQHSRHYYQHTTRHGGKNKIDPQVSLFSAMYRKMSYEIFQSDDESLTASFTSYVEKHVAASHIQAMYRGYIVRRLLRDRGYDAIVDKSRKEIVIAEVHAMLHPTKVRSTLQVSAQQASLLDGFTFVFVGSVPTQKKKRWTHVSLEHEVYALGGRVSKGLPGNTKGRSTKNYHVLINTSTLTKKAPDIVREAVHRGYSVLDYGFLFECMEKKSVPSTDGYNFDHSLIMPSVNKEPTLYQQHFQKQPRMISLLKKANRAQNTEQRDTPKCHVEQNAAQFYANIKRKTALEEMQRGFLDQAKLFGTYCTDYMSLPQEDKDHYHSLWKEKKQQVAQNLQKQKDLIVYNQVGCPLYKNV